MKIIIAPDSFKNSIDSITLCNELEKEIHKILPDSRTIKIPVSDGGEGFIDAICQSINLEIIQKEVTGPDLQPVIAKYGISENVAYLEMAQSSGLQLVENSNPMYTTTFGLGEIILDAIDKDIRDFIIGIGGSATNDGGAGMAQAVGFEFINQCGTKIHQKMNGNLIGKIEHIITPNLPKLNIQVACDVKNPLLGCHGAVYTYAMQKGATVHDLLPLETNLSNLADVWYKDLLKDVYHIPGSGAAGGLGGGLMAFLEAKLVSGAELLLNILDFDNRIQDADLIITGEGKIDNQTNHGKIISEILNQAKKQKIPVYGICGILDNEYNSDDFEKIVQLSEFGDDSMENPRKYILKAVEDLLSHKL